MQEQLQKKHQTEKGGKPLQCASIYLSLSISIYSSEALDAQKEMYEKQLSVLRDQLQESAVTKQSLPAPPNTLVLASNKAPPAEDIFVIPSLNRV